jgi:hypothetical protein
MNWIAQAAVAAQKKCKAEALQLNASDHVPFPAAAILSRLDRILPRL